MAEFIETIKDALLRRQEVERLTGFSRSAIYARLNPVSPQYDPDFPKPVPMGNHAVRWVSGEVQAWIHGRIKARDTHSAVA